MKLKLEGNEATNALTILIENYFLFKILNPAKLSLTY